MTARAFVAGAMLVMIAGCGQKAAPGNTANVAAAGPAAEPPPLVEPPAENMADGPPPAFGTLVTGYLLGVMQRPDRTGASGGRNEWVMTLDPERDTLLYAELVEGQPSRIAGPYKAPVVSGERATLVAGDLSVTFRPEPCESDHGALGRGNVRATVTIAGQPAPDPITMCMVSRRPSADVARPDWTEEAF